MSTVPELVGENVRALRHVAGLTQAELADAMRTVGFSWHRQTVGEIEEGRRPLTVEELVAVAAYFEMPIAALLVSPSMSFTHDEVTVGSVPLPGADWVHLVTAVDEREPPKAPRRRAIDRLMDGLERPWAKVWRRRGGHPAGAFTEAREQVLAGRRALPGPIYVTHEDVTRSTVFAPWGETHAVTLRAREPYVPRDDQEREMLDGLVDDGLARRITRQQAYRLRQRRTRKEKS